MISKVVKGGKVNDGQLDDCDITNKDIQKKLSIPL